MKAGEYTRICKVCETIATPFGNIKKSCKNFENQLKTSTFAVLFGKKRYRCELTPNLNLLHLAT
jgi:hypothetical protein